MKRAWDEVSKIADFAKLDVSSLAEPIQSLYIDNISHTDLKLIELNSELLSELENGQSLVIRGLPEDEILLCTQNKCYDVKEVDTSNSLLLLPNLIFPDNQLCEPITESPKVNIIQCKGPFHSYLEVKEGKPKLHRILEYLKDCPYKGREVEAESTNKKYTLSDFLSLIPASETQILQELKELQACYIQGHWRILDVDYKFRVLSHILKFVEENSWDQGDINKEETIMTLSELEPSEILEQVFDYFMQKSVGKDKFSFSYNIEEISRFYAEILLKPGGKFNMVEFFQIWKDSVPEGIEVDEKVLEGLALIDKTVDPPVVWYFSARDLPDAPQDRLSVLFKQQKVWSLQQFLPYMLPVCGSKQNVMNLLNKLCRSYKQNGQTVFTSKYCKL